MYYISYKHEYGDGYLTKLGFSSLRERESRQLLISKLLLVKVPFLKKDWTLKSSLSYLKEHLR